MEDSDFDIGSIKLLELMTLMDLTLLKPAFTVSPWLTPQNAIMIYADRGLGKTFFAMSLALSIVSGTSFLGWEVPNPEGVLYVDGEMSLSLLQARFKQLMGNHIKPIKPLAIANSEHLRDFNGLLNLSNIKRQEDFIKLIPEGCKIMILDNISCLFGDVDENDSKAWHPIQSWIIRLRALGYTIILIHHTNKSGGQRGASKREDCLDVVIKLSAKNLSDSTGAQFQVEFTKHRAFTSDTVGKILATLCPETGKWTHTSIDEAENKKIIELYNEGCKQEEIAEEMDINQSTVSRKLKVLRAKGLIH